MAVENILGIPREVVGVGLVATSMSLLAGLAVWDFIRQRGYYKEGSERRERERLVDNDFKRAISAWDHFNDLMDRRERILIESFPQLDQY